MYFLADKRIYIYGAGDMGKNVKCVLQCRGKEVEGFIDRRSSDFNLYYGVKVYSVDEMTGIEDKDSCVIILTFKNVYQHNDVAKHFQKMGFYNIVFQPLLVLFQQKTDRLKIISEAHHILTDGHTFFSQQIPDIENCKLDAVIKEEIIKEDKDDIIFYVPMELLFIYDREEYGVLKGKNILSTYPSVSMFQGFQHADWESLNEGVDEYIENVAKISVQSNEVVANKNWEMNIIESKKKVYEEMKKQSSLHAEYFIEYCARVRFSFPCRFKIYSSGKNRVSFLIAEGHQYIPIRASKDDYEKYINFDVASELETHVNEIVVAPVPHPWFYHLSVKAGDYSSVFLGRMGRDLANHIYKRQKNYEFDTVKVIDMMTDEGTAGRYLQNIGFNVTRFETHDICEILDRLFRAEIKSYNPNLNEKYHICLLSDSYILEGKLEVLRCVLDICYVIQWTKNIDTRNALNTYGFIFEQTLFTTYWDGNLVEGMIFRKVQ